jgi:hypothetical protein
MSGGLFILHGLIATVGTRFNSDHCQKIIAYLVSAMTDLKLADDLGVRMSCGLVSDLCNNLSGQVVPHLS